MTFHFFAVPASDSAAAQEHLNDFCQRHRVVSVDRQFVNDGANSHWAICIQIAGRFDCGSHSDQTACQKLSNLITSCDVVSN